jgi:hypothetical protein
MPERLNKLIIYPFMWYGRAIWNFIKVFIDKRTQDKVVLLAENSSWSSSSSGGSSGCRVPQEVSKYIYLEDIPVCCGGTNTDPPLDILSTLPPDSTPAAAITSSFSSSTAVVGETIEIGPMTESESKSRSMKSNSEIQIPAV